MIPTRLGRWQTRILLMTSLGLPITLGFAVLYHDFMTPFVLLAYITLVGLFWDIFYNFLQTLRWDRDWPPIFSFFSGVVEALFLWALLQARFLWAAFDRPAMPGVSPDLTLIQFTAHYMTVWLITFLILLGPLKTVFLHWRFRGGQWLGRL